MTINEATEQAYKKGYEDGIAFAKDNNVPSKWIPASEPPKDDTEDQWVIFKTASGWQYTTGYFDGKDWRSAITDFTIPVVGWMPLPEPPKGE